MSRTFRNKVRPHNQNRNPNSRLDFEKCEPRNMLSLSVGAPAGFEQLALNHIGSQQETSYLLQNASDLHLVEVTDSDTGTISVFEQSYEGLPIHGSYVSVLQGFKGEVQQVVDRGVRFVATTDTMNPGLNASQAQGIAHADVNVRTAIESSAELAWFRLGDRAELSWRVSTAIEGANVNQSDLEFMTIVDANEGQVLSQSQSPTAIEDLVYETENGVYPRIVINNAIGAAGSRAYAAPFDSVVALTLGCTGTLVADNVVISARHCGASAGSTIRFGDNSNSPVYIATVQSSSLPDGNGSLLDGGDVAILTLTANVPSSVATPMRFIDATSDLVGQVAATLGYGYNGLGSTGHGFSADGWRWGGENVIDVYGSPASNSGSNIISTDFDNGSSANNTIPSSSATPLTFEATTAPGDSGGPILVQQGSEWLIAGVLSGGTTSTSVYGDISWWTGTAIYRAEIEAAGGVFAGGGFGTVNLDQENYFFGDTINISVNDDNGIDPLNVTVTSDSGDSETITLSNGGSGSIYSGSIATSDAGVSTGDGVLQAADSDTITVTYNDPDDGSGGSNTVNDTATIFALPDGGVLVGVEFDEPGTAPPTNWLSIGGGSNATFNNLFDEMGAPTNIDLAISELADGAWSDFEALLDPATIPLHSNSLVNLDGQIYTGADPIQLSYSDLNPFAEYEIYIFSAEGFYAGIEQTVTITGDGAPVVFDQDFDNGDLFINDQLGDSSRTLAEYAQVIVADASGQIVINVDPIPGTSDVVLAGVAIAEVPVIDLIDPLGTKFLDGVPSGGSLADAQFSDDVYYQLSPSPTTNPNKQKIDLILVGESTVATASSFEFYLEASMTGGPEGDVIQSINLWNETDGVWELFDTRAATNSDTSVVVTPAGDLSRFIHPLTNEIIARVSWVSDSFAGAPFFWNVDVDQFGWDIS